MILILLLIFIPILYSLNTKNPPGTNVSSDFKDADCKFLYDLTYLKDGKRIHEQEIFKSEMEIIKNAKKFLMIDFSSTMMNTTSPWTFQIKWKR